MYLIEMPMYALPTHLPAPLLSGESESETESDGEEEESEN